MNLKKHKNSGKTIGAVLQARQDIRHFFGKWFETSHFLYVCNDYFKLVHLGPV